MRIGKKSVAKIALTDSLIVSGRLVGGSLVAGSLLAGLLGHRQPVQAQPVQAQTLPVLPPQDTLPSQRSPLPEQQPEALPPAADILDPPEAPPLAPSSPPDAAAPDAASPNTVFTIERYAFVNNTAFSDEVLQQVTEPFVGEERTFADVAAARAAVTQLYVDAGYVTSGAIAPPQQIIDGVVTLELVEGRLSDVEITGLKRLRPGYIRSRIALATDTPLNIDRLIERLQLIQLDPLIDNISADLQAGVAPGTNTLVVSVAEADSFKLDYSVDNNRSPSVGSLRNQLQLTEGNLLGMGDRLSLGYTLTSSRDQLNGSNTFDAAYTLPISPRGTTVTLAADISDSNVIEPPFEVLDIDSDNDFYEIGIRHPLIETPTQEFAIGLSASHQRAQTAVGLDDIGPFPLSEGADDQGRTRVSALHFSQEWTQRSPVQVLALRSQFNVGIDVLDATNNDDAPDGQFVSWQGQGQWVRVLSPDTLLLLKGEVQLANDSLLSLEQLNFGGQSTVRGYRQNLLSTDNGVLASAEVRLPLWKDRDNDALLQVTPFLDTGYGWNARGDSPDPLVGVGVGLLYQQQNFTARLDYGIPLISANLDNRDSLQENGVYFTLQSSFL